MTVIRAEYHRFLQSLTTEPEPLRKLAKLIAAHLDELVPLSTHQGQRVKQVVGLAQANWETINPEIPPSAEKSEDLAAVFSHLTRATIGPFRGFSKQEVFDLKGRLILIYGPNGTGKSSFCEALEYGLLGNVAEAESKRFRDQNGYLKNAYVDQFAPPNIFAEDHLGNETEITPNNAAYRFCFVEKNRIDSFSKITAQAPAKQTELISTLFGLELFTEFVRNFTAEIDSRYIDTTGQKALLLAQKQQTLTGAHQQIKGNADELESISLEEVRLASQYREHSSFNQMILEINGQNETQGAVERIEIELQQPLAAKSNLSSAALVALQISTATTLHKLKQTQSNLTAASQELSFKILYEAVSLVQPNSPNTCPACKTPLHQVTVNPYFHAGQELQKLQQLANLQQEAITLDRNINQSLLSLSGIIHTCLRHYPQNNSIKQFEVENNGQPGVEWWYSLHRQMADGFTPWQHLQHQVKQLESDDSGIDKAQQLRNTKKDQLSVLRGYSRQITVLQTRRQSADKAITSAQITINNFQIENTQLIAEVEGERTGIAKNQAISSAYKSFVRALNNYSNSLPSQLVADLGELVVILYNAFNRNDSQAELLANMTLPLTQNQRMTISFCSHPEKFYDALHILSEGHIRCLGLAILLAKNLKVNAPMLIFDDPVNAIDDDHRESIRRTLFEDQYFSGKQILLTCHGEEFFKDIQNLLPAHIASQTKLFSFLPKLGEQHIKVDFNCSTRNYILAARGHISRGELREALAKSRQALETLTKGKLWRYVTKYGDGNLSLKLRSSSSPIELRNLSEQLMQKIGKESFSDTNKNSVANPIQTLLGLSGSSREWRYLNKGTHEESDRAEFDRQTVESIVSSLEKLDAVL